MIRTIMLAGVVAISAGTASAQEVGRWCDIPVPGLSSIDNLMVLKAEGGDQFSLTLSYGDGSGRTEKLTKRGSRYVTQGNDFGEFYTIRSNGQLAINDNDGFIRAARPANGVSNVRDCR